MSAQHPPAGVHSLWRLRGYLRPHLRALSVMTSTALLNVALTIAIPLVTKAIIDGPIAHDEIAPVLPLGLLALALGVLEASLIFVRRWVQSGAVLGMETEMRHDLYARLQELPMAFHGQWQSGQLLSRVTNDLSSLRRFFGFGLIFLGMNILQLVLVTGVLLHMYWPLGLVVAVVRDPDRGALAPVRARLRRDLAPGPGPAGRPRHAGRGGRRRHPRDQVVRPGPVRLPASTTSPRAPSTTRRWTRSGWPRSSGRSSRSSRTSPSSWCCSWAPGASAPEP